MTLNRSRQALGTAGNRSKLIVIGYTFTNDDMAAAQHLWLRLDCMAYRTQVDLRLC